MGGFIVMIVGALIVCVGAYKSFKATYDLPAHMALLWMLVGSVITVIGLLWLAL